MREGLKIRGDLEIYKNGILVSTNKNLVVNTGLNYILDRTLDAVSHMAIGEGTTAVDPTDTDLESVVGSRIALTSTTVTANQIQYAATFSGTTHAGAITEAGLFNDVSAGIMISHVIFNVVNVGATDEIVITWTITLANE